MTSKRVRSNQTPTAVQERRNPFEFLSRLFTSEISETNIRRLLVGRDEKELLRIVSNHCRDAGKLDRLDIILYKLLGNNFDKEITVEVKQLGNLIRQKVLGERTNCG